MTDPESLIAKVQVAFSGEALPPRDALFNGHCPECIEMSEAFGGKPWVDITLENLLAGSETALLSPTAWRYYLPAVMTWCLRAPQAVDVIRDNLVYQLEPPAKDDGGWFAERCGSFNEQQRETIVDYLNSYRERQETEYAALEMAPPEHVYKALAHWANETAARR